jgi:hypothetical protein
VDLAAGVAAEVLAEYKPEPEPEKKPEPKSEQQNLKPDFRLGGGGGGGGKEEAPGTGDATAAAKTKAIIELPQRKSDESILRRTQIRINGDFTYL